MAYQNFICISGLDNSVDFGLGSQERVSISLMISIIQNVIKKKKMKTYKMLLKKKKSYTILIRHNKNNIVITFI